MSMDCVVDSSSLDRHLVSEEQQIVETFLPSSKKIPCDFSCSVHRRKQFRNEWFLDIFEKVSSHAESTAITLTDIDVE